MVTFSVWTAFRRPPAGQVRDPAASMLWRKQSRNMERGISNDGRDL